ncbi:MAG TPA: transcription termination factor Rho, partial [Pedococcus sp.]|nr:transcription termination factor Rho [Pedococcus sp.]
QDGDTRRNRDDQQDDYQQDERQQGDRQQGARQGQYRGDRQNDRQQTDRQGQGERQQSDRQQGNRQNDRQGQGERQSDRQSDRQQDDRRSDRQDQGQGGPRDDDGDADGRGGRRRSRNRNRSRDKRGSRVRGDFGGDYDHEPQLTEDDVLVPVAGILDVLDNYAFVRTSGYLPGPGDVYVPLGLVKKNGMRKGDAVTGAVKAQRETDQQNQRQKFNALVRLDTVNGMSPDDARKRVEFGKLTPLYPQQRLRLETDPNLITTRVIDLVAPIGKGQRGLIVAPAKAGKTMVMQAIANAITTNNPECHLMVVLVDERPEEVTDMQRAVKGEVISSTFDRPADDHTTVAELAIERAKRLVEMGHDVVVLLDSITKLGRAYNLSAPASGRILSGGVDSAALYPPKKFFGAARNIEDGGSLTILATALVETGSRMDEVIFEEFKGTGNMELKLDRGLANRRIFPAVDVNNSGTRKEEILLSSEELKIMWKLRRVLAALDQQQGIELLIDRLKKTKSNVEFLMQVQQNSSLKPHDENG